MSCSKATSTMEITRRPSTLTMTPCARRMIPISMSTRHAPTMCLGQEPEAVQNLNPIVYRDNGKEHGIYYLELIV